MNARVFTDDEIKAQEQQTEKVRINGGSADYQNDYAFLYYMTKGEVPDTDAYGHRIDTKAAVKEIRDRLNYWDFCERGTA